MKFDWQIKLGDILHILLLLATIFGVWTALNDWKVQMQDHIEQITSHQATSDVDQKATWIFLQGMDRRLARIEGKLNTSNGKED